MPPEAALRSRAIQVLVIDDDECLRELINLHLWRAGYDVRLAADAIEAGRLVLEAAPDVMIVDVNMPYMDGFEFVAAVRADETMPFIPVVFLTAESESAARARALGAACLVKPVQADKLLTAVALGALMQRPQPRVARADPRA
jgi:CheY-like chemotaxis protein